MDPDGGTGVFDVVFVPTAGGEEPGSVNSDLVDDCSVLCFAMLSSRPTFRVI